MTYIKLCGLSVKLKKRLGMRSRSFQIHLNACDRCFARISNKMRCVSMRRRKRDKELIFRSIRGTIPGAFVTL